MENAAPVNAPSRAKCVAVVPSTASSVPASPALPLATSDQAAVAAADLEDGECESGVTRPPTHHSYGARLTGDATKKRSWEGDNDFDETGRPPHGKSGRRGDGERHRGDDGGWGHERHGDGRSDRLNRYGLVSRDQQNRKKPWDSSERVLVKDVVQKVQGAVPKWPTAPASTAGTLAPLRAISTGEVAHEDPQNAVAALFHMCVPLYVFLRFETLPTASSTEEAWDRLDHRALFLRFREKVLQATVPIIHKNALAQCTAVYLKLWALLDAATSPDTQGSITMTHVMHGYAWMREFLKVVEQGLPMYSVELLRTPVVANAGAGGARK